MCEKPEVPENVNITDDQDVTAPAAPSNADMTKSIGDAEVSTRDD